MSHTEEPLKKKKDTYLQCHALVSLFLFVFVSVLLIAGEPGVKQAKKKKALSIHKKFNEEYGKWRQRAHT